MRAVDKFSLHTAERSSASAPSHSPDVGSALARGHTTHTGHIPVGAVAVRAPQPHITSSAVGAQAGLIQMQMTAQRCVPLITDDRSKRAENRTICVWPATENSDNLTDAVTFCHLMTLFASVSACAGRTCDLLHLF